MTQSLGLGRLLQRKHYTRSIYASCVTKSAPLPINKIEKPVVRRRSRNPVQPNSQIKLGDRPSEDFLINDARLAIRYSENGASRRTVSRDKWRDLPLWLIAMVSHGRLYNISIGHVIGLRRSPASRVLGRDGLAPVRGEWFAVFQVSRLPRSQKFIRYIKIRAEIYPRGRRYSSIPPWISSENFARKEGCGSKIIKLSSRQ